MKKLNFIDNVFNKLDAFSKNILGNIFVIFGFIYTLFVDLWTETGNGSNWLFKILVAAGYFLTVYIYINQRNERSNHKYDEDGNRLYDRWNVSFIVFPFVIFMASMFHFNNHRDGSHVWLVENSRVELANTMTFNIMPWKSPEGMIVRDRYFGNYISTSGKPIKILIKNGEFTVHQELSVVLDEKIWKEFNFDEVKLREFLRKDLKNTVTQNDEVCKLEKLNNFKFKFVYEGTNIASADLYQRKKYN